jgi:hypothetical protein
MKRAGYLLWITLFLLGAGCAGPGDEQKTEPAAQTGDIVSQAAEIARAIEADPDTAEQVLERHDLTVEEFEQMMYEIRADPELSKAFEAAVAD